jgi:hypothetical protein
VPGHWIARDPHALVGAKGFAMPPWLSTDSGVSVTSRRSPGCRNSEGGELAYSVCQSCAVFVVHQIGTAP